MEGLVLEALDYKEHSKIVYLYTPNGKIGIKVFGIKEKIGFLTTLNYVEFSGTESSFPTLKEYLLIKSYFSFYENMQAVGVIMVMLQVLQNLEPDAPHSRIFPFVIKCLDALMEVKDKRFILSLFLIKMLAVFGVKPVFKECIQCGNLDVSSFDIMRGGALCKACSREDTSFLLEAFKRLYYKTDFKEENLDYESLLRGIYLYYSVHIQMKLKEYRFGS